MAEWEIFGYIDCYFPVYFFEAALNNLYCIKPFTDKGDLTTAEG